MKKWLYVSLLVVILGVLSACGEEDNNNEIKVGATSVPHAEILEEIKPMLEEEGITLTIETYTDYALPNEDLSRGEIDANYFQHRPFLNLTIEDQGYDIVELGGVHIEPLGIYSKDILSIEDIEEKTEVIMSRSITDHGRVLGLFESNGFITLKEGVAQSDATIEDIEDNPLDLLFTASVNPEFLIEAYENEAGTLVAINGNYALEGGLNPLEDALFIEGADSEYVNIVAVKEEDQDDENLQKLVEILQSEDVAKFITEKYDGQVVPVSGAN